MAYTNLAGSFDAPVAEPGALKRFLASFFAARTDRAMVGRPEARKLAGPMPGDRRARGYLDDLDIEVGF